jgi:hypothetical protein
MRRNGTESYHLFDELAMWELEVKNNIKSPKYTKECNIFMHIFNLDIYLSIDIRI